MRTNNIIKRTNTKHISLALLTISLLFPIATWAAAKQDSTTIQEDKAISLDNFDINFNLKNMHTWHGSVVTPGAMMATSMEYKSNNDKFIVGLWGGTSFNGTYKEFSYYTSYQFTDRFKTSFISHNNYSDSENPNIFSYDKFTSPNFVDIVLEYTVSDRLPLNIYWSTILFGQGGDFETDATGDITNSFSNYVQLSYPVLKKENTQLSLFAGGAFSFSTEKTFYSEKANIVNAGIKLDQNIKMFNTVLPVSATALWNPETKLGVLQLDIALF